MSIRLSEKQLKSILQQNKDIKTEMPVKKPNKYYNEKVTVDGITYDSKKEYKRFCQLRILEKAGMISNLRYHNKEDKLILQESPLITYIPDFCYNEKGCFIIEDLKGYQTKEFKLKKKMIINKIQNNNIVAKFRLTKFISGQCVIIEEY